MMQTRQSRKRRPLTTAAPPSGRLVDGVLRCQLNQDQRLRLAEVSRLPHLRDTKISHEVAVMIERFWRTDAVFCLQPSDADQEKVLANARRSVTDAVGALQNKDLRSVIDWAQPHNYDFQNFDRLLDELQSRLNSANPRGREAVWNINSNRQDRPFSRFLGELIVFWHLDLGQPLTIDVKQSGKSSPLVGFCQKCAELAGRPISSFALRGQIKKVLAEMDKNSPSRKPPYWKPD